jgi:quinol monooxygenase YgiN
MIYVLAVIEVVPGKREAFLAEFRKIVPLVRAEGGCLEYGPAIDLDTGIPAQAALRENVVTVIEKWATVEALRAHLQAPHMADYRSRVRELVTRVQLHILQPA